MATFSNQKTVKINKVPWDKDSRYTKIDLQALNIAVASLPPSALPMWLYLNGNGDRFEVRLSRVYMMGAYNFTKRQYYDSIEYLKDRGYLVERNGGWSFYELPQAAKDVADMIKEKKIKRHQFSFQADAGGAAHAQEVKNPHGRIPADDNDDEEFEF